MIPGSARATSSQPTGTNKQALSAKTLQPPAASIIWLSIERPQVKARAAPEIILVHRFYDGDDGEQKAALLRHIPEMAETSALRSGQIRIIGVKRVFPALDNVDVALQMAKWFQVCRKNLH